MIALEVIKRPIVSEKSSIVAEAGVYTFEVDPRATKPEILNAIQKVFKVKVIGVRTLNCRNRARIKGKTISQVRYWKKAIVQLEPGQKIKMFEGA